MTYKSLQNLGLDEKEQAVYLALLQLEKASGNDVARKTGLKRPTVYDILYRLEDDNFVYRTEENKKMYFITNSPEQLIKNIENKKRELLSDLPLLMSIYNTKAKRPKVAYFEGRSGIIQLYEDTLTSCKKGDEILSYVASETLDFLGDYTPDYVGRRAAKGILSRGISQKTPAVLKETADNPQKLRTTKLVNPKDFPMKNEINIYADKVIIITYSPEPFGVLIESKEIADTQRSIFKMAWNGIR